MNLIKFLLAQFVSWLVILFCTLKLHLLSTNLSYLAWLQGLLATVCSWGFRQPYWWTPIHLFFFPAALFVLTLDIPAEAYLGMTTMLTLIFWGTIKGDVPLFLSSSQVADIVIQTVESENAHTFADLGAGIGSVAIPVARKLSGIVVDAWERAPLPWLITRWRGQPLANMHSYRNSFWDCNLRHYDVIFAFLSPAAMPEMGIKAKAEMHPGALLISSSFPIIDWEPERILQLEDTRKTRLYFYRQPGKTKILG